MIEKLKHFGGLFGRSAERRLGRLTENYIKKLDNLLIAAGEPGEFKGVELFGLQLVALLVLPLLLGVILSQIPWFSFMFHGPKQALFYVALMAVGFFFLAKFIQEKAQKRQKTIGLQLPDTLDLLTISVEAGLDFMGAMR